MQTIDYEFKNARFKSFGRETLLCRNAAQYPLNKRQNKLEVEESRELCAEVCRWVAVVSFFFRGSFGYTKYYRMDTSRIRKAF